MTETGARPRRRKLWKYLLFATIASVLALAGLAWYTTTDSFQALVHRRVVSDLERITGGRVDLGGFHTSPFRLRVEVENLTIHGREPAGEVPYAHVGASSPRSESFLSWRPSSDSAPSYSIIR
jgi:hypothetical protein